MKKTLLILVLVACSILLYLRSDSGFVSERHPDTSICVGEYCDGSHDADAQKISVVDIPLIQDGGTIGCGADLFFAPHTVPYTKAPLDASYRLLFDLKGVSDIASDGLRNPVAAYPRLFYDHVDLNEGRARLFLKGELYGPGHCSLPELRAQLSHTALHFDTVDTIEVYLNGDLYDWCEQDLSSGEGPCPETAQWWIDTN